MAKAGHRYHVDGERWPFGAWRGWVQDRDSSELFDGTFSAPDKWSDNPPNVENVLDCVVDCDRQYRRQLMDAAHQPERGTAAMQSSASYESCLNGCER
ncbi:MAG: hypothetical protein HY270_12000 [Deltaproteobacteria bacterium]|nr:hypothetical protein [Deltaproteobacteria bacterium]